MNDHKIILKVLVGSQAHGLANADSDYDYRSVYVVPTERILSLGAGPKTTHWLEGEQDDTQWELGHFLNLASKCNPTILETFLAPVQEITEEGQMVRDLFPHVWNTHGVTNAFIGYGQNQRKKFLEEKDGRPHKFAAAYLRSLYNGYELLTTGTFTVRVADTEIGQTVRNFKEGRYTFGEVINECRHWETMVREAAASCTKETDLGKINEVLLKIRRMHL